LVKLALSLESHNVREESKKSFTEEARKKVKEELKKMME